MSNRVVIKRSISSTSGRPLNLTPSVYGGAGGYGTKVSSSMGYAPLKFSVNQYSSGDNFLMTGNEKMTMQNLNDRLATYLEKVRSLESANSQLEFKIKEHYGKVSPATGRDFSKYYQTIQDLQGQIQNATQENGRLLLQVDNARLAADDFRMKFETELSIRQNVEGDIAGLRRLLDDLTMKRTDLELQIEQLQEELVYLKKNHSAEVEEFSKQLGGSVSVEVDAAPSVDLGKMMADMRAQYDDLAQKNRDEAKQRFEKESQQLIMEVTVSSEELGTKKSEITEVRRKVQGLEIELQSQLSMKAALEGTLADTEARYGAQVAQIQAQINNLMAQLSQIRADMEQQRTDYSMLLNIKLRLEMEIAEYRRLLEGEEVSWELEKQRLEEAAREQDKQRKIKTIVEEVVDGKVVSSKVNEIVEKM
ncbi:keratin, type I cytoskeletal 20-like [Lissotriton helveticus]